MARPSIARRLAIGLAGGMALIWIGAVAIAGATMQSELNETFDEALRQAAFRLLPLAHELAERDREGPDSERPAERSPVGVLGTDEEYFTYFVRDRFGNVVLRAEDATPDLSAANVPDGISEIGGRQIFATTDPRSGYGIVVIEQTDHRSEAISDGMIALVLPLIALVPLIGLGIWYAIRMAMRPVRRLSQDVARRNRRNLAPISADGQPVELAPIADAVASLLDRLRAALDAERAFAASSAHELRTPIAGALAQTQLLQLELGESAGSGRVREIEAALKQLSQLSERLLQLSRLEAGFAEAEKAVDLLPVLRLVVRDFQSSAGEARVSLHEEDDVRLIVAINLDAFAIAIRNLLQNALIHGASDGPIEVFAGPGATVRVVNHGVVISAEQRQHLAEPFVRGETDAQGSGLGLSIVRAILEQTGGKLTFHSPATNRTDGFEAVAAWPADLAFQ